MTVQPASQPPPDQDQRDLIVSALDRNVVVEAAAGTGKTTSMVDRMVALLRTGACDDIRRMAAVTFTRKAASELRDRFRLALEKAVRGAAGDERGRLAGALDSIDQCFVGTIHSFCGRLLRERPIEAGVDLAFEELDEDADMRLRQEAWAAYAESVIGLGPGSVIDELDDLNLDLSDLADTFYRFAEYPDVDDWPLPPESEMLEDLDEAAVAVKRFTERMRKLADRLPRECGSDRLMPRYSKMPRVVSHYEDLSERASMLELIDMFFDKRSGAVLKEWVQKGGFTQEEARSEREAWDAFREEFAAPLAEAWRELRYRTVMKVITEAGAVYDRMRAERGQLDFQDLLMKAAGLLKGSPHVRSYFAGRYSHLLVDEFQDTDPIQAEVMLLLTATDPRQDDWRLCVPRGGSLFVVGDPKQSIYRFRRADIVTYNRVKRMILEGDGGKGRGIEVRLFANFRTSAAVIQWIDEVFAPKGDCTDKSGRLVCFPEAASEQSPAYVRLEAGRSESLQGELGGVFQLTIPSDEILLTSHLVEGGPPTAQEAAVLARRYTRSELAASYEADLIARYIRWAIDDRVTVPRSEKELEDIHRRMPSCEDPAALRAEDFLIITRNKTHLSTYGQALQRYGIPHRVTGGTALNEVEELRLLLTCLRAVDRVDDPVALVGALRSELFGISDAALYRFRRNGGRFNYNGPVPEGLPPGDEEAITDAFDRLRRYRGWVKTMPPLAAFEKVVSDLGLMVLAATRDGGDVQAGSLGKALELLRGDQRAHWSTSHLVDFLADLVEGEFSYDGVSARSHEVGAVRVMNLHKAKGLESTVVFLADGSGEPRSGPEIVIDRGGDRTIGYIGVFGPRWGAWYRPLLAAPGGWADRQAVEKEFEAAERLRLRYVAATRAGSAMIVCEREDGRANGSNPWKYFRDHLAGVPDLPDPGPGSAPSREALDISVEDVTKASEEAAGRMRRAEGPTYARLAAKEYALRGKDFAKGSGTFAPSTTGGPEYGINWGTAMHMLLELAMSRPGFDVEAWAERVLGENEIDPGETPRAVETVRAVTGSALWERALASDLCLTEVPFHMLLGDADIPTTMNGAMDLAFREEGGWVIVDYKTDRISASRSERALADEYAPQLELYGRAWAGCTGETVKETGLFFVDNRTYHRIR
ncbi:MAG: UvrD-helicase domain-containing protein [Actinobacteria bacterium]|nr:UvrD-helicase domain-containing protein [Actinomycetota bacterium]